MSKPRLLDLFCGAGGCSTGYHRAGFEVIGIDLDWQENYPFEFYCMDALHAPPGSNPGVAIIDGLIPRRLCGPGKAHASIANVEAVRATRRRSPVFRGTRGRD